MFSLNDVIYVVPSSGAGRCHWYSLSKGPCQISEDAGEYTVHNFPDVSPDGSRVVYATTRHKTRHPLSEKITRRYEIEIVSLDGSNRRRLTKDGNLNTSPVWSVDGTRIAFLSFGGGVIATMDPDGSDIRRVAPFSYADPEDARLADRRPSLGDFGLAWSPDGEWFAFVAHEVDETQEDGPFHEVLCTVRQDGSEYRRAFVPPQGIIHGVPAWSPDSRLIAFLQPGEDMSESVALFTIMPDGSGLKKVVGVPQYTYHRGAYSATLHVEWSPGGSQILFSEDSTPVADQPVHVVNADGSGLRVIGEGAHASWSPDGSRIAIVAMGEEGSGQVYTVAPDGSDRRLLWE